MVARSVFSMVVLASVASTSWAGHESPSYIDGCQSVDGRFVVTAELTIDPGPKAAVHGPFDWVFVWKDTKEDKTVKISAQGLQKAQIYAQMYIAPDGETFALFNHVTDACEKSLMHGPRDMRAAWEGKTGFPDREEFTKRLIVYKKDGSIVRSIGVKDILTPYEWASVVPFFDRVHWLKEYDQLYFKMTPWVGYAFHRVSPDYTILEITVFPAKGAKAGRVVRIDMTTGRILEQKEWPTAENKVPVRPFVGRTTVKDLPPTSADYFVPSLDPVRVEGKFNLPAPK